MELVMAKPFRAEIMLIKEDLPTFERPMNAYSGFSEQGQDAKPGQLFTNSAVFMSIVFGFLRLAARRMDFMDPGLRQSCHAPSCGCAANITIYGVQTKVLAFQYLPMRIWQKHFFLVQGMEIF